MCFLLMFALAHADSADSAPYEDSDAKVELVYSQKQGGCGGGKSAMVLVTLGLLMGTVPRRREQ